MESCNLLSPRLRKSIWDMRPIQNIFPQLVFLRGWMAERCKICNLQWGRDINALQLKKTHGKGENSGYLWKQLHQFDNQWAKFRKHAAQQSRIQKSCQNWKVVPVDTSAKTALTCLYLHLLQFGKFLKPGPCSVRLHQVFIRMLTVKRGCHHPPCFNKFESFS